MKTKNAIAALTRAGFAVDGYSNSFGVNHRITASLEGSDYSIDFIDQDGVVVCLSTTNRTQQKAEPNSGLTDRDYKSYFDSMKGAIGYATYRMEGK